MITAWSPSSTGVSVRGRWPSFCAASTCSPAQQVNAAGCGWTALDAVDVDRRALRIATHVDGDPAAALRSLPLLVGDALERGRRAAQQVRLDQITHRQPAQQIARASFVARAEGACRRQRARLRGFGAMAELQELIRIQRPIDPRQAAQEVGLAVGTAPAISSRASCVLPPPARGARVSSRQCRGTSSPAAASAPFGRRRHRSKRSRRDPRWDCRPWPVRRPRPSPPRPQAWPPPADRLDDVSLLATTGRT